MADYYASPTGNDTSGNGSVLPWATVSKGIATIGTATAATFELAAGTYAENTSSLGYLSVDRESGSAVLTIQGATGDPNDVVITGTSGTVDTIVVTTGPTDHVHFKDLTIRSRLNTTQYLCRFSGSAAVTDVTFENVIFDQKIGGSTVAKRSFYILPSAGVTVDGVSFTNCTFKVTGTGTENVQHLAVNRNATGTVSNLTVTGCDFTTTGACANIVGVTALSFTENVAKGGTLVAVNIGADAGLTNPACTGTVTGNKINAGTSHGLLVGNGCNAVLVERNIVTGGDYTFVLKNNGACDVRGNTFVGNSATDYACYAKAPGTATFTGNICVGQKSGGYAFYSGEDATGTTTYDTVVACGNILIGRNGARLVRFASTEETGSASVCNYNTYLQLGTGAFGLIDGGTCTTLAALRTAWDTYNTGTNDDDSVVGTATSFQYIGMSGGSKMGLGL